MMDAQLRTRRGSRERARERKTGDRETEVREADRCCCKCSQGRAKLCPKSSAVDGSDAASGETRDGRRLLGIRPDIDGTRHGERGARSLAVHPGTALQM